MCVTLIVIGAAWIMIMLAGDIAISGIATRAAFPTGAWYSAILLAGPLLLILGPTLVLINANRRLGVVLLIIGCLLVTLLALTDIVISYHVAPLQRKPDYIDHIINAIMALVVFGCDYLALGLYRYVFVSAGR